MRDIKTIVDAYKETHRVLLQYCNVTSPDDVAPVWKQLANSHKSKQHTLLSTQEKQKVYMAPGLSTKVYVPVLTTSLKQMVTGFQSAGHSANDLATGKRKTMVASSTVGSILYLSFRPIINQSFRGSRFSSLFSPTSVRFPFAFSYLFRVIVLRKLSNVPQTN